MQKRAVSLHGVFDSSVFDSSVFDLKNINPRMVKTDSL
ncbi:hypothetical protein GPAL_2000 [Glaciecola pallidula DSM 14239 = ACAM 615]|uniref:Uncharacterized protein n=1 Tax=Brumicola pallidula DSM 14239 = ACAM 615 TaxID=1121922 RepID=K6YY45_9ALTE|nr:hypothetical protein GPAL_2000 [Glaciecola pallidula DSM 14239 = ACAM 615]